MTSLTTTTLHQLLAEIDHHKGHATLAETLTPSWLSKARKIITLKYDDTVEDAMKTLAKNKILSAPVVLPPKQQAGGHSESKTNAFLGVIDQMGLMKCVVQEVLPAADGQVGKQQWDALHDKGDKLLKAQLISKCGNDTFLVFNNQKMSAMDLIHDGFLGRAGNNHRVLLADDKGALTHLITQTDFVRYVSKHTECAGKHVSSTVTELGYTEGKTGTVVTFPVSGNAIDAFKTMFKNHVSSVALVDSEGKLVGNLSASDLKGMTPDSFSVLSKTVTAFQAYQGSAHTGEVLSVHPDSTFNEALQTFAKAKTHRLYIVAYGGADKGKPVGIITLTDVLTTLATLAPKVQKQLNVMGAAQSAHCDLVERKLNVLMDTISGPSGLAPHKKA